MYLLFDFQEIAVDAELFLFGERADGEEPGDGSLRPVDALWPASEDDPVVGQEESSLGWQQLKLVPGSAVGYQVASKAGRSHQFLSG